ncbi:MAG: hypothetical protein KDB27_23020 [Planctomycetales bacterium]|nr:hypothetical protein [Planctomycetales bacterium]
MNIFDFKRVLFVSAVLGMLGGVVWAGNNKCCKSIDKLNGCSGCIGWDDDDDDEIDWYMDIGNHSGKKCEDGGTGNCDEEAIECANVNNLTKYKRRVGGVCQGQDGTAAGPYSINVNQCNSSDTQCSSS